MRRDAHAVFFFKHAVDAVRLVLSDVGKAVAGGAEEVIVCARLRVVADRSVADVKPYRLPALAKNAEVAVNGGKAHLREILFQLTPEPFGARVAGDAAQKRQKRVALL